jgi:hypothetical protein
VYRLSLKQPFASVRAFARMAKGEFKLVLSGAPADLLRAHMFQGDLTIRAFTRMAKVGLALVLS